MCNLVWIVVIYQVIPLPDSCSLRDICVNFWDRKSKFELFYHEKLL